MSRTRKGRKLSPEHCAGISRGKKGFRLSKESIEKANRTKKEKLVFHGEDNPNALISDKMAVTIIRCFQSGMTCKQIVIKYGVSSETAYNILYNRTYKHILPDEREELVYANKERQERKVNKAIELYIKGYSQNRISKKLKMSRNTIRREINNRKIKVG